jgi:oxygen-independent coproporphyrinogen-3 oxidase
MIKSLNFPVTNIDLIYGSAGQTLDSWLTTLETAMTYKPEEMYLYPLYVRPLTGLEKMGMSWDNFRLQLYRAGKDYLLNNGYQQVSMRMFSLKEKSTAHSTVYCCQEDGMVGLGVGARSYTKHLHYSTEYAVGRNGVKEIIQAYIQSSDADFQQATYGIYLNEEERKRRYVIKSLLHADGLDLRRYKDIFQTYAFRDFPQLLELAELKFAYTGDEDKLQLTSAGLERSDTMALLYTPNLFNN